MFAPRGNPRRGWHARAAALLSPADGRRTTDNERRSRQSLDFGCQRVLGLEVVSEHPHGYSGAAPVRS